MDEKTVRNWMIKHLKYEPREFDYGGEINRTKLAEYCGDELEIYEENSECDIPEWIYDLACEVADLFEKEKIQ